MGGDNLKRHMKRHKKKTYSIDLVTEKIEYHAKNEIVWGSNEYQRKLELGREIKQIVQEFHAPTAYLNKERMEALTFF